MACAFGMEACKQSITVKYVRLPDLLLDLDAAREAGAGGGTVVHAKGTAATHAEKFFGVSLAEEKEMIFIVTSQVKKKDIMRSIMEKAGIHSDAHTLVFSLPVADTAGFRLFTAEDVNKK